MSRSERWANGALAVALCGAALYMMTLAWMWLLGMN